MFLLLFLSCYFQETSTASSSGIATPASNLGEDANIHSTDANNATLASNDSADCEKQANGDTEMSAESTPMTEDVEMVQLPAETIALAVS